MSKYTILISLIGLLVIQAVGADEPVKESVLLTLPKIDWVLDINVASLVLSSKEINPAGTAARFQGRDKKTGIVISVFLEEHSKPGTAQECRDFYWTKALGSPYKKDDIKKSNFKGMAIGEYTIKEFKGFRVDHKHFNAYLTKGKFWIDVHLSKVDYKENEERLFKSILNRIKIVDKKEISDVRAHYKISEQGVLRLDVPKNWCDQMLQESDDMPVNIELDPPSGTSLKLLITVLWDRKQNPEFNTAKSIKEFVEDTGSQVLGQAVEDKLEIKEMRKGRGKGYFFRLTDKAPKPGEYKYLIQGAYGLKKLQLVFTILTNEEDPEVEKVALDVITSSKELKGKNKSPQR